MQQQVECTIFAAKSTRIRQLLGVSGRCLFEVKRALAKLAGQYAAFQAALRLCIRIALAPTISAVEVTPSRPRTAVALDLLRLSSQLEEEEDGEEEEEEVVVVVVVVEKRQAVARSSAAW